MRKLTEENKQLATNLKREIDEMNPRAAAKSAKSIKKKTAGSDLSSARGSEERQSLPPGRGQKRGRDNEIEKVRSSISSTPSPRRASSRGKKPSKKALESMEPGEDSSSPPGKRRKAVPSTSDQSAQVSAGNAMEQQAGETPLRMSDSRELDLTPTAPVSAKRKASEADIDIDFWAEEAALLDVDFSYGSMKYAAANPKVQVSSANDLTVTKTPPKKRARTEDYAPLNKVSDAVLASKVSKMLRHKAKTIGVGLDPPWRTERPKGPQRHPKWSHTLHVDSHNHAKLAFYAEISPSENPVIAGFPPKNPPPGLALKSKASSPPTRKRKAKKVPCGNGSHPKEQPATKRRRRIDSSTSHDSSQRNLAQGSAQPLEIPAEADNQGTKDTPQDRQIAPEDTQQVRSIGQGFQTLKEQLEVQDSGDETNSDLEQEEHFHARPAVKIEVPDHLKSILVDDWENVTKNLSLVPIPAEHPVSEILSTYFEEEKGKRRLGSAEADLLEEVVQGTKDYFEHCLGKLLLYRFEREQYFRLHQAIEKGKDEFEGRPLKEKKIADIYGAEHLCRLFGNSSNLPNLKTLHLVTKIEQANQVSLIAIVSLPELIAQTNMDAQSVAKLRQEIQALTAWLGKNSTRFFTGEYEAAPQEYLEKARGL